MSDFPFLRKHLLLPAAYVCPRAGPRQALQELRGSWETESYLSVTCAPLASLCSPLWDGPCTQKCAVTDQGLAWVAGLIAVTSCAVFPKAKGSAHQR